MRSSGQTGITRIKSDIRATSYDAFVDIVEELVQLFIPGVHKTRRLRELDRKGLDLIAWGEGDEPLVGLQCKGFEVPFGKDQLEHCQTEIAKFVRIGQRVDRYLLILNRRVPSPDREVLDAALQAVVAAGKARQAELLDLDRLVAFLQRSAEALLAHWADQRRSSLKAEFEARLQIVSYIPDVPFHAGEAGVGPIAHIMARLKAFQAEVRPENYGPDRFPPRVLITSSFGFGKTTTLHTLAADWIAQGHHALYMPAALLPNEAFTHTAGLVETILNLLIPDGLEVPDLGWLVLRETLKNGLARSPSWILIIDAIDENAVWSSRQRLGGLWGAIRDLGIPTIVSVRDEVFMLRQREFQDGGGRSLHADFFAELKLEEWTPTLIDRFLSDFAAGAQGNAAPAFLRLQALVRSGGYESVYGDIPRRPLFLGMLADDAWDGVEPERDLHRLYGMYLRRKLEHDRYSAGAPGTLVRLSESEDFLGRQEYVERMIEAMQDVAMEMLTGPAGEIVGDLTLFKESRLIAIFESYLGRPVKPEEIYLNSILQPAGRGANGRMFRFAHQSFFDWFFARRAVFGPHPTDHSDKPFYSAMLADAEDGRGAP